MTSTLCALFFAGLLYLTGVSSQDCSSAIAIPVFDTLRLESPLYSTGEVSPESPCNIVQLLLQSEPGTTLSLTCEDFEVNCLYTPYIYAFSVTPPLTEVCGNTFPGVTSTSNSLNVTITSLLNHYGIPEIRQPLRFRCNVQKIDPSVTTTPPTTLVPPCDCGTRLSGFDDKIVGGENAAEGEFPYQVSLLRRSFLPYCGATLISAEYVVTAASCNPEKWDYAVFGERQLSVYTGNEFYTVIDTVLIHPLYNSTTLHWNVALLKLSQQVTFTDYIRPICLADNFQDETFPFVNETLQYSGWGSLSQDTQGSDILQKVVGTVISKDECRTYSAVYDGRVVLETLCTLQAGSDACNGDFGGPLVIHSLGRTYFIGIISFSTCGMENAPTGFLRVANAGILAWIKLNAGILCNAP